MYNNRKVNVPTSIALSLFCVLLSALLCAIFSFINIKQSTYEIAKLQQQLIIERTINHSLSKKYTSIIQE